jgi:uncharacterized protein DUF4260
MAHPFAPAVLLRVEGAAALFLGVLLYEHHGDSWWLFVALCLAPDLSMAGYLVNPRIGAASYNLIHTYAGPALLAGIGVATDGFSLVSVALIWLAHIGADRALGFGLKYASGFNDTHFARV